MKNKLAKRIQSYLIIGTKKSLRCINCTQVSSRKAHCTGKWIII